MRIIIRKERPHPGLTSVTCSRCRGARCADRIRVGKDTGLRNLPLHDFTQNQIWLAIVMLACEITAWMQMLALHGHEARRWEPKRPRLRLFSIAGRIARTGGRTHLHVSATAPWAGLLITALAVSRTIQNRTGLSIRHVLRQLRPLRSATIELNGVTRTYPPAINDHQQAILDNITNPAARH